MPTNIFIHSFSEGVKVYLVSGVRLFWLIQTCLRTRSPLLNPSQALLLGRTMGFIFLEDGHLEKP